MRVHYKNLFLFKNLIIDMINGEKNNLISMMKFGNLYWRWTLILEKKNREAELPIWELIYIKDGLSFGKEK